MNTQLLTIKAKKFGVRLSGYRQRKGVSAESLSQWTGIPKDQMEKVESGQETLSLPQVEMIALKLGLLPDTLIYGKLEADPVSHPEPMVLEKYQNLRNRMISLILRKARTEQNKSVSEISQKLDITEAELEQYESGGIAIPLPFLECLCEEYALPLSELFSKSQPEQNSPSPSTAPASTETQTTDEMSEFVQNPANQPYLQLAKKLSELDSAKLRGIAEGLLEITY